MDSGSNIKCTSCKKDVANEYVRCTSCINPFHPGCYKPHRILGPAREKTTCSGTAEPGKRGLTAPPPAHSSSPLTGASSLATDAPSSGATLTAVLAAVQRCSDTLASFQTSQLRHNGEVDGHLSNLKKDLSGKLDRLSSDLKSVAAKVREVETRMDHLKEDLQSAKQQHEAVATTFTSRITAIEEEQRTYADVVKKLVHRFTLHEEGKRATQIVISGIPEQAREDLRQTVLSTAKTLGSAITPTDILRVSRMKGTEDPERPRLIHVELSSKNIRDSLLSAKRRKGPLTTTEVDPKLPSRAVYLNEYLPREVLQLLRAVRTEARTRGYRHIWHRAGAILVKKDNDAQIITIRNHDEISAKLR